MNNNQFILNLHGEDYSIAWDDIGADSPALSVDRLDAGLVHIRLAQEIKAETPQDDWQVRVRLNRSADFHWAPHLTPEEGYIIDQHVFRCPAVIACDSSVLTAVIPDLVVLKESENRWYMDLDAKLEEITLGVSECAVTEHVLFKRKKGNVFKKGIFTFSFFIFCSKDKTDIMNPFKAVLDFHWNRTAKALFEKTKIPNSLFLRYCEYAYKWAFESWRDVVWQEFTLNGKRVGAPAFIVNYTQCKGYTGYPTWREPLSIWNQAWFCSLRSASGLFRFAKRTGSQALKEKALLTKELVLNMPKKNGLFYSVVATRMKAESVPGGQIYKSEGWESLYFGNSNRNPVTGDIEKSPFHILDMSFTCLNMVRWYKELEKDKRLIEYATGYIKRLMELQRPDGFFPAWVDEEGKSVGILDDSPETSMSVTLLTEFYELTGDKACLESALRAAKAVMDNIIEKGRWEDFETYWSCCRWGEQYIGRKIERNDMYKQCNFSMFWTSEALYSLYKATGDHVFLHKGKRVLDEMLMTQSVWQPGYMKVPVFGGFGVMNCDGEWLDARQSLFAEIIMKYGIELGEESYIKRGIAALRASFQMMYCPENARVKCLWEKKYPFFSPDDYGFTMENYGHDGVIDEDYSGMGEFTIYDWGNGAASEAYMRISDHFGQLLDAYG